MKKGLLLVICGPSGAGKGTIYNIVLKNMPEIKRSISVTTRKPRPGEEEGVDYYFRTVEQYQQMIAANEFLETASVFNNLYGTPKARVMDILQKGEDILFEIDVVGARQIKAKYSESILIFIMTPDFKTLENRLRCRGTESDEGIKTRLNGAYNELLQYPMFDYFVVNDKAENAAATIESIIKAERQKLGRNTQIIQRIIKEAER